MSYELRYIIVHWTAGGYKATSTDINAYHYIIQGDGSTVNGSHSVWNNAYTNMKKINRFTGNYAHHTGGGNTGAIGVALAGMAGYIFGRSGSTNYPLKKFQCEMAFKFLAKLCKEYQIDPANVWTHYEFALQHPRSESAGKIDITYLPPYPQLRYNEVGGYIRNRIREILGYQIIRMPETGAPRALSNPSQSSGITGAAANIEDTAREVYGSEADVLATTTPTNDSGSTLVEEGSLFRNYKDTSGKPLAWLRTSNNWLEQLPRVVTTSLNNMVGKGEDITQSKVDSICAWLAYKVNVAIEEKRQDLIRAAYAQYTSNTKGPVWRAAFAIQAFFSDPVGAVGSFASSIFKPVKVVFEWVKALMEEVPRLAANLANIVSTLPPSPPTPQINFDKFKLKVNSIGMKEIAKGPAGLKDPEDMFPKPINPYQQDSFILFGDNSAEFIDEALQKKQYNLKPDDFESMNSIITKQSKSSILDQDLSITYISSADRIKEIDEAFASGKSLDIEKSDLEKSSDYFFE